MNAQNSSLDDASRQVRRAAMKKIGRRRQRGKIPFVQQVTATECGAACLSMVLGYFGRAVNVSELREAAGIGRDGSSAKTLVQIARIYGLRARGVSLDVEKLAYLPKASILHWGFNHFVVFERARKGAIDVIDPGLGRRRIPLEEFGKQFTGVALVFDITDSFEPREKTRSRTWHYISQLFSYTGHLPKILTTSVLVQIFALAVPVLTGLLVDRVVPRDDANLLMVMGIGLAALVLFFFLASMIRAHLLLHLRTLFDARMTLDFLDHMIKLPYAFFQKRSTGDLLARINSNSTIREIFTSGALSGILDGGLVFLYLAVLFWMSPTIGLLVVTLAIMQISVVVLSRHRQRDLMAQNLHIQARSDSYLVEMLSGIETLKAMGGEQRCVDRWTDTYVDVLNVSIERGRLNALVESLNATLRLASPLCVLCYGAVSVMRGDLTLGTMLGLNALAAGFFMPLSSLMGTAVQLQLLGSYIERIDDVLDTDREQDPQGLQPAPDLQGKIELDHVSFRYSALAPLVVKDVSVSVQPGEFVAIVGRSGSGKSTLASLLVGLYQPIAGRVMYDGMDVNVMELDSLRQQIGTVSQNPYLFGNTIRGNIALANPSMPLEQVRAAAMLACIHDDIATMPMNYDTMLVDAGASLSGGQRQRVALARALAADPKILVLDEATSALDAVTETAVQRSLNRLPCTRVVIAHRLSTVVHADRILVMEGGCLVEQGSHEELLAQQGVYAGLVAAQMETDGEIR